MKKSLIKASALVLSALMATVALADDDKKAAAEKAPSKAAASEDTVASKLKGKLVSLKDKKLADYELKGKPEFYVFYHSASW